MPILLIATAEAISQQQALLAHLDQHLPGQLILAANPALPPDLCPQPLVDWLQLPPGRPGADQLGRSWLLSAAGRFEVGAALAIDAADALVALPCLAEHRLLIESGPPTSAWGGNRIGTNPDMRPLVDEWLEWHAPLEVFAGPGTSEDLLQSIANRAARDPDCHLVVFWRGGPSPALNMFLDRLAKQPIASVELRLLTSELLELQRSGPTHAPADFLSRKAMQQLWGLTRSAGTGCTRVG